MLSTKNETVAASSSGDGRNDLVASHYAAIVESSDDAIISKSLCGIIRSWNRGAERLFGYTAEEAIGKPIQMLIPAARANEEADIIARIKNGERIDHYETVRLRKDGSSINISLTISPIKNQGGDVVGASKIARDISSQVVARAELEKARHDLDVANAELEKRVIERTALLKEAVAQMEEFSYTITHDLRSPVRAMKGYANAILESQTAHLSELETEYLWRIIRGSTRMDKMIQDVLVYSRLNRAKLILEPVDLDKLMADTLLSYEEFQPARADIKIKGRLGKVVAHDFSLVQALANLMGNAVKFVEPGTLPKIEIWAARKEDSTRLWIKDNGVGINPEYQGRIFGMFERAHQDPRFAGTGVGLAIVRKIMEKMNGKVGVESDGKNGCSFWIEFPSAI